MNAEELNEITKVALGVLDVRSELSRVMSMYNITHNEASPELEEAFKLLARSHGAINKVICDISNDTIRMEGREDGK